MAAYVDLEDSLETINHYLYQQGMTDGLPVIPPTEARVAAMIAGSGRPAGEVIGELPPLQAPATVEKIAINAVMAGCEPAYMPALVTTVRALLDPNLDLHGIQTTTNPVGPVIFFNGPIRRKLEINCSSGCLGPGTKANATIGRAVRLILLNIGGAQPGEVDKAVLGWPGKSTSCCFGENEEESPWEPYHVELGFDATDSTVTVLPANGMWPIYDMSPDPPIMLHHVTHGMAVTGHSGGPVPETFQQVLIISPEIAKMIARLLPTKAAFKRHLFENARVPLSWYPPNRHEVSRERMEALKLDIHDDLVPLCERPEDFLIICAGGNGGIHSCGMSMMLGRAATHKIE
jgi:hypothetical protein